MYFCLVFCNKNFQNAAEGELSLSNKYDVII